MVTLKLTRLEFSLLVTSINENINDNVITRLLTSQKHRKKKAEDEIRKLKKLRTKLESTLNPGGKRP